MSEPLPGTPGPGDVPAPPGPPEPAGGSESTEAPDAPAALDTPIAPDAPAVPATPEPKPERPAPRPAKPAPPAEAVEIIFKGRRRDYFLNPRELPVHVGDHVVVQAERGEDLGRVHHTTAWVKREHLPSNTRPILRTARPEDLEALDRNRAKEERAFRITKDRIAQRDLEMKLVDAEYQLDGNRVTFYFTADKRIDFRDLVKDLASTFRTRIELRQIGVRDESGRIGGVGTCGRELCCATWLREFEPITLKMAKDQGLSPSPSKISGACGRLKCCLRYELDFYRTSNREFPKIGSRLTLRDGEWEVGAVDIFRRTLRLVEPDGERERSLELEEIPEGTVIVGPTRDRRKGCDKENCASRGARPGDGESGQPRQHQRPRSDRRSNAGNERDRDRGGKPGGERRGGPGSERRGGPGSERGDRPGGERGDRPGGERRDRPGSDRRDERGPES